MSTDDVVGLAFAVVGVGLVVYKIGIPYAGGNIFLSSAILIFIGVLLFGVGYGISIIFSIIYILLNKAIFGKLKKNVK